MASRRWGALDRLRHSVHLPFAGVGAIVLIGLIRIVFYHWRQGGALLALAMLFAAVLRAALPTDAIGLLAVRSKAVDVLLYAGFGVLLAFVAVTIVGGPLG
ncbi:MAG: DUF3017 domain-containing protein [Sciscionella sp.]